MAKKQISTTPKEDKPLDTILDHFGIVDEPKAKKQEPEAKPVDVDALVARMDRLEQDNQTLTQSNIALMSSPRQPYAPVAPVVAEKKVTLTDGLPDPVSEPEAYGRELEARIADKIDSVVSKVNAAQEAQKSSSSRIEALWSEFADHPLYKEYAQNADWVEFAATKVAKRAQQKGLNIDTYMFTTSDQFFKDVASEIDKTFPKKEEEGKPLPKAPKVEEEELRTSGVFGGVESGSKPAADKDEDPGDMLKDLEDLQRKSVYF